MAVINPDVASLMSKAEQNSKYNTSNIDLLISSKNNKNKKMAVFVKLPSFPTGSSSMMDSFKITKFLKINNS